MKVFLSHSSRDKALVGAVANRLGRSYVIYDDYSFETAEQFKKSIQEGLDKSKIFVLFASTNSLQSEWVKAELDQAQLLKVSGSIHKIIVIVIDPAFDINRLPEWLKKARAVSLDNVASIVREIRYHLQQQIEDDQAGLFVGRRSEMEEAERVLSPKDTFEEPHVVSFYGVQGVGRKTLARHVASDILSLPKNAVFRVEQGDGLAELAAKLFEDRNPSKSLDEAKKRLKELQDKNENDLVDQFSLVTASFTKARELVVLQDEGGLLDRDGRLNSEFVAAFKQINELGESRLALVLRRRPNYDVGESRLPAIAVRDLKLEDIRRLVSRKLRNAALSADEAEVSELSEYVAGYPPAVDYLVEVAKAQGVQKVILDKSELVDFTAGYMLRELDNYGKLSQQRREILILLALYSPLPLEIIGEVTSLKPEELGAELSYLLDCAFVMPDRRLYRLVDPLVNAVLRRYGRKWSGHERVASALEARIADLDDDSEDKLLLGRALYRASEISGRKLNDQLSVYFTSDLVRLAQRYYHDRDFESALRLAKAALDAKPGNLEVRGYYVRALIQLERFEDANSEIVRLENSGYTREATFLRGFFLRKQHQYGPAIEAYLKSVSAGRTGVAIHRELAQCYFEVGELKDAQKHIAEATRRDKDNRYVLDLEVQIALRLKDKKQAYSKLGVLRIVDEERFFYHRRSTVEYAFKEFKEAVASARLAFEGFQHAPFAIYSQLIKSVIAVGALDEAERHLDEMDKRFSATHFDMRLGLRCKYEIARGDPEKALAVWERLRDKTRPVHLSLKLGALNLLYNKKPTTELRDEIETLQVQVNRYDIDVLDIEFATVVE